MPDRSTILIVLAYAYLLGWLGFIVITAPEYREYPTPPRTEAGMEIRNQQYYLKDTAVDYKEVGSALLTVVIAPIALLGVGVFFLMLAVGKLFGVEYRDYPDAPRRKR
jgi:hypothetical protein